MLVPMAARYRHPGAEDLRRVIFRHVCPERNFASHITARVVVAEIASELWLSDPTRDLDGELTNLALTRPEELIQTVMAVYAALLPLTHLSDRQRAAVAQQVYVAHPVSVTV